MIDMHGYQKMIFTVAVSMMLLFSPTMTMGFAQENKELSNMHKKADEHFMIGEYKQAIEIYDEILDISPTSKKSALMKGIALSNLERHKSSILEFYKVNQQDSQNITALIGLGAGFGNLGEYKQALTYFEQAYELQPENHIVENYYNFATKTVKKYPYNEVKKPQVFTLNIPETIPTWIKNTAGWWATDKIPDEEFVKSLQFLIENNIITVQSSEKTHSTLQTIPTWIKNTAGWWATDKIPDEEFLKGINFLIDNGLLVVGMSNIQKISEEEQKIKDRNEWEFTRYLDRIEKTVYEKRDLVST